MRTFVNVENPNEIGGKGANGAVDGVGCPHPSQNMFLIHVALFDMAKGRSNDRAIHGFQGLDMVSEEHTKADAADIHTASPLGVVEHLEDKVSHMRGGLLVDSVLVDHPTPIGLSESLGFRFGESLDDHATGTGKVTGLLTGGYHLLAISLKEYGNRLDIANLILV